MFKLTAPARILGMALVVAAVIPATAGASEISPSEHATLVRASSDAPTTVYLPNVTRMLGGADGWQTPFIVQNVGSVDTDLAMSFYAFSDGSLVKTRAVNKLHPGTSVFHDPNSDTELAAGGQYSVVIRSTASPVVAVVNEHQAVTSPTRQEALSYSGLSGGSTVVFLPYVVKNTNGWLTTIIMQNLGTAPATVTARFVSTIAPVVTITRVIDIGRSQFIDPTVEPTVLAGTEYGVTLTSTQPIGAVVNAHNDAANVAAPRGFSYNGQSASSGTSTFLPYVARRSDAIERTSRLFVQNAGNATATPQMILRRHGDNTFHADVTGPALAPGAVWAWDPLTASQIGDGDWSLEAFNGNFAIIGAALSPATAMGLTGTTGFATRVFLPNVTRTLGGPQGWTTPIIVESTGAPFFTINFYRFADGVFAATQTYTDLLPAEAIRIDPRSIPQLTDNTQYAAVIEAAVGGVAAAVIETNLGGGDSAMGYDGFVAPPANAYGTTGCDPLTVPSGSTIHCAFYGLAAGATPVANIAAPGMSPLVVSDSRMVAPDGSWDLWSRPTIEGQWSLSLNAAGVSRTVTFFVTAPTFSATVTQVTTTSLTVNTKTGTLCQPDLTLPTGSAVSGFFLSQKTAGATGAITWTYSLPPGTRSGQALATVRCYLGAEQHNWNEPFTVP